VFPLEAHFRAQGYNLIAGIDEAGRGPMAGPLVSAAVILKPEVQIATLNDSKKLTARRREALFDEVLAAAIDYAIAIVPPQLIDSHNILRATQMANDLALRALKAKPDLALIDGRDKQILSTPFLTIIKGDSLVASIAAASILAKVTRDRIMQRFAAEFPLYGFEKHFGYGTRLHRLNIEKYGRCELHRQTFTFSDE
jgi:ribonuclease HII